MESSFRIGRIGDIEIGIHYSWLIAFGLVSWSLAAGFFPSQFPGWDLASYWAVAVISTLLLFASVLVHELSHSYVALMRGMQVQSIVLFVFGGVSNIRGDAREPEDEFFMAVAGPLTSLSLAVFFWVLLQIAGVVSQQVNATLGYLAVVNLMLGVFNLLPGFPLDGGRVLRSLLWRASGNLFSATRTAAAVGQLLAYLFIFGGLSLALLGNILTGLWLVLLGWFLSSASESSLRQLTVEEMFRGVRVAQLMDPTPVTAPPGLTVRELVDQYVLGHGLRAVPVVEDGRLKGIITLVDVKHLPQERWGDTRVGDVMTSHGLVTVSPRDDLQKALMLLGEGQFHQLPVVEDSHLVGMLTRADIIRYLQVREELGVRASARTKEQRQS